jgi:tetratricopeptide (TPR) repeat protein
MKQHIFIVLFLCLAIAASGQKSKVLAVTQMIDAGKFEEAKEEIELAIWNDKTSRWPRTYYAKGLLCQTAFEGGKKTNLYPDQLFVAYDSYEKALELDVRERLHNSIRQKYYLLANDFIKLGQELYQKNDYCASFRAFESALLIGNSELVSAKTDTNLVYNTAMAAYECENWDKAIQFLTGLHEDAYSTNVTLLLATASLQAGDSIRSQEVLKEGLVLYQYDEPLVMYLVNLLAESGSLDAAMEIIDRAVKARPDSYRFHWAKGLIYRRMNNYKEAVDSFLKAAEISPDQALLCYHLGVCYYNMGIELRESALKIDVNDEYLEIREQYLEKFREAVKWLELSYALDPTDEETVSKLYQLYYQLQMKEEQEKLQHLLND